MEIAIAVAAKIAEYTVAPIGRQVGYVFSYKGNFNELKDQVKELEVAREGIQNLVEAEKRNGKEIVTDVREWLNSVDKITEEAENLSKNPLHAEAGCSKWSFSNLCWRYQLSKKAKKVVKNVVEARGKGKFNAVAFLPALGGVGSISITSCFVTFESRMSIVKEILQALQDPNVSMVGLYGFGGVGKSTLMKQVAGKVRGEKLFDAVVMAKVSKNLDFKRIQGEIADQLGLTFTEETVVGRSIRLRDRIKREKKILIILDDIWTTFEMEEVGIPNLEKGGIRPGDDCVGCKVLLTSRNENVLNMMGTRKNFRLDVLSEEETWSLFEIKAGDVVKGPSFHQTAVEVAKNCAGLPVLIVAIARALNNRDIYAWKATLDELRRVENRDLHEITISTLELSFNWLESEEVKALFLLCGILGPHVQVNYLLKCVMGLGIFKQTLTLEDARNKLYKLIGSLKASCLLLEGDTNVEVKMHDIIQGVAISIASRDQNTFMVRKDSDLKEWPTENFLKRCSQIIMDCCFHKLPEGLECPELKFFYLYSVNRTLEIPDSFFQGMGNLKMVDLTCMNLSSLPKSFCCLTNLQTLCLDVCALGDMSAIGVLKNLEILSLYQSSITILPTEIGELTNLRMLDLSNSRIEVIPPKIISSLTKLEELYMGNTFIKWEVDNSTRQNKNASLAELKRLPNLIALDIQIQDASLLPRDLMFEKLERYNIFIGDVWKWIGNHETSKTLKLKLGTCIHLEQGIRALIRRVEDLYLDEIQGISNVLYQLNGDGFPLLKHLWIQNNAMIHHIVNSLERNQARDSFPNLEILVLDNLHNLEKICHGPLSVNSFSRLRVVKVNNCYQLTYLFSISMVKGFSQLLEIDVSKCNSMKRIVSVESGTGVNSGITIDKIEFCRLQSLTLHHLPTLDAFYSDELAVNVPMPFFNAKVSFPKLETLKLSSMNFYKIWDDNLQILAYSIQNLTKLIVEDCSDLKYLFSSSVVGSLSNLKWLEISKCHMMEEIIATNRQADNCVALQEVQFPKLETIIISDMKNLKTTWHYQFDGVKTMEIKNCEKVEIIFPSDMQRKFCSLETLMVTDCDSVKEIFELNTNDICSKEDKTKLKKMTLLRLPKLKQIWSKDPQGILHCHNLQVVHVDDCQILEYLFPFSIAMGLQLEEITVKQAQRMKELVAKKEGPENSPPIFVFDRLTSLVLWNLHKLERFYAGNHTLACPSLRKVFVFNCKRMNLFKTQTMSSQGQASNSIHHISMQQSFFTVEELIPNLEHLTLNEKDTSMLLQGQLSGDFFSNLKQLRLYNFEDEQATFPYWFLQNVPNLEWLFVDYSAFKEIFRDERFADEEGHIKVRTRLKKLTLHELRGLKYICKEGSKIDPILEALEYIIVKRCSNMVNLVSSSNSFSHLTYLEIGSCNRLRNLVASSTARSLAKLREMKITDCNSLETVVFEKGDETKEGIEFSSLETLELSSLPQLCKFCLSKCFIKFPLLEEVIIRRCPRMEIFSEGDTNTPSLRKVQVEEDDKECFWEGNLNRTIKKLFVDKVAFHSFKHLNLSDYPELKDLWYSQLQHKIFCNLKTLVVQKCKFLSDVLFHSNAIEVLHRLEDLEVRECDSLEAVFDFKVMDENRMPVKQNTQLRKLTLSGLPKLKHIWKKGPREVVTFGNLQVMHVVECQNLTNLCSVSLCQDLTQLEELIIESCGIEEFITMEEGQEEHRFSFPELTKLRLCCLTKLKSFYPGRHTLECTSLKNFSVYHCEALHIFDFDCSNFQQLHQVNEPIQQALFSFEKVSPNLEVLTLNENDVMKIRNGHYQSTLFNKVELLSLQCFHQTASFPTDFIQRFLNLVTLQVRCSSFEMLFPCNHSTGTPKQTRKLWLFDLEQLKYIWDENSQLDPLDQKLEDLQIVGCSSLLKLMPSSISFNNLTNLYVADCKRLIYFITSSTAKSLMHLISMTIKNCEMIEDVVHIDEEAEEIKFENLKYLQLNSLSSLKSFCCGKSTFIFPSLLKLVVTGCPKIKMFSSGVPMVPMLRVVEVEHGKKRWKDDLNTTIQQLFTEKVLKASGPKNSEVFTVGTSMINEAM